MTAHRTGSCQCGQVSYQVESDPLMTYACHCHDCQKRTGSAFSMGAVFAITALKLNGKLSAWKRVSDDGNTNTRHSCSQCGNIIYGVSTVSPTTMNLQVGTLNRTQDIKPDVHIWTKSAQAWVNIPVGDLSYDTQPENLMDLFTAIQGSKIST